MKMSRGFEKNKISFKILFTNSGQATIEAVLLATILIGGFLFATKTMQDKEVLQKFTTTSVGRVKNMAEYGTWRESCKPIAGSGSERAANCHPNSINRALSSAPE
jgi:hypothetical protein